jgi:hypothetical protein
MMSGVTCKPQLDGVLMDLEALCSATFPLRHDRVCRSPEPWAEQSEDAEASYVTARLNNIVQEKHLLI